MPGDFHGLAVHPHPPPLEAPPALDPRGYFIRPHAWIGTPDESLFPGDTASVWYLRGDLGVAPTGLFARADSVPGSRGDFRLVVSLHVDNDSFAVGRTDRDGG